jgi:enterochelin esterase family protein
MHRYPLLVVHDGDDYLEYTSAKTVLDNLVHRLEVAEVVAVFTTSTDRLVEYADDPRHHRFVVEELVPQLERDLPLVGAARGRCLVGSSFGGIASFTTALAYPGEIGSLLLQSTSFLVRDIGQEGVPAVFDPIVAMLTRYRADPVRVAERIYQTCGAYEPMIAGNRAMVPVLQASGAHLRYVEARDGHNWENWRDRLRDALSWLFPGPQKYVYE